MKAGFKENLKMLRAAKGISQTELARVLNTTFKTVSHWETGYSEPSVAQIVELAKYFGVSTDELLCK